jgi:hypothetical protein
MFADSVLRAADRLQSGQGFRQPGIPLRVPAAAARAEARPNLSLRLSVNPAGTPGTSVAELDLDAGHLGRLVQRAQDLAEARAELSGALVLVD